MSRNLNVCGICTASANKRFGTNFKTYYKQGDNHSEISKLKRNLRDYRNDIEHYDRSAFSGVPSLSGNSSNYYDEATKLNVRRFQELEKLGADGIYGAESRNRMHLAVGVSSKGYQRLNTETSCYINYNDTKSGLRADSSTKLDHSWLTPKALSTLYQLASSFKNKTGQKLQINDCCLMDGADTPDHRTHEDGKDADIRSTVMSTSQQKTFLEICIAHPDVEKILFGYSRDLSSTKLKIRSDHRDHFHIDFK